MNKTKIVLEEIRSGNIRSLSRAITLVENELGNYASILKEGEINRSIPIIGITGPPGAGKSTLVNGLLRIYSEMGKKVGVLAIDPSSPFHLGAILGDRIRMVDHFNNPNIFIRSLATRGALGGLSSKAIEISDLMRIFPFDLIIIETVGVGQSEIEIIGIADQTVLVLVPEAGDEVQAIKAGIMEIADVFVINKSDREGADLFASNIKKLMHESSKTTSVVQTVGTSESGLLDLIKCINFDVNASSQKQALLYADRAFRIIQNRRMHDIDREKLIQEISQQLLLTDFNLYKFVDQYLPLN